MDNTGRIWTDPAEIKIQQKALAKLGRELTEISEHESNELHKRPQHQRVQHLAKMRRRAKNKAARKARRRR